MIATSPTGLPQMPQTQWTYFAVRRRSGSPRSIGSEGTGWLCQASLEDRPNPLEPIARRQPPKGLSCPLVGGTSSIALEHLR